MKNELNNINNTLDSIPEVENDAKSIIGLVKEHGKVTGYRLSDETDVSKQEGVELAKQGRIKGVGIAHRGDAEYLKSIPNDDDSDNLGYLPSVRPSRRGR